MTAMRVVIVLEEDHCSAIVETPVKAGIAKIIFKASVKERPAGAGNTASLVCGLYLVPDRSRLCRLLCLDEPIHVCNGVAGIEWLMQGNDALPHLSCRIRLIVAD